MRVALELASRGSVDFAVESNEMILNVFHSAASDAKDTSDRERAIASFWADKGIVSGGTAGTKSCRLIDCNRSLKDV